MFLLKMGRSAVIEPLSYERPADSRPYNLYIDILMNILPF